MPAMAMALKAGQGIIRCIRGFLAPHHPTPLAPQCVGRTCAAREAKRYLAQP